MAESFVTGDWREGRAKQSFNYLLLDPRDLDRLGKLKLLFVMLLIIFIYHFTANHAIHA